LVLWLLLTGFGAINYLPMFIYLPPNVALATLIGSLIYSLLTALTLKIIDNKVDLV
jgi:hypothetical protein